MGKEGSTAAFLGKKPQVYNSMVKALSQAKVMSAFKCTATSESLERILLNPPSYGSIGGSSKISRLPKYFCLLGMNAAKHH